MTKVAIIYHSGYGHTAVVAEAVAEGVKRGGASVDLVKLESAGQDFTAALDAVSGADAVIFGSPTYMGDVSAVLKAFFEASSKAWMTLAWKDKIAAGFTNGLTPGGNKDNTLGSMIVLAMQHGMIWVGTGLPPGNFEANSKAAPEATNRFSYALGAVAQSDNAAPEITPPAGDKETGRLLGERVAKLAARFTA